MTIRMAASFLILLLIASFVNTIVASVIAAGDIGGPCLEGRTPCQQNNANCVDRTCRCANFSHSVNGTCIPKDQSKTLGKPCRGGNDCTGQGEFCSSFSICMCLSTHVDIGTSCEAAVYPGQFGCEDSRQCNKGFPGAECDSLKHCICPFGMLAYQQTCVIPSTASNVILSDDQFGRHLFQQGSRYSNNFYRRRYSPTSNSVLGVPPDTICSADSDCAGYPLAYCDGVCRCNQGALNAGSTCISSGNAVQPAGSCPPGQTYVTETGSCMTVQMPGEPCQYSQQCAAAETGAFCLRLKCQCIYGMRETGGGCTFIDNQCTKRGSIFISELGECRDVIPPGGRGCSHSLQCTSAYQESTCFLQTCTCPPTHPVAIDGTCGRNCSAGETYSGVTGQCLPTVQPGDQCLYSSQCHSIYPGMICERSRCRCPNGMVFSGSKCSQTCPTGFIINSRGICMPGCRTNQVEFEGECLDQAAPDSPCVVNAQCIGGASCQNGACTCPKAMVAQGNMCKHAESAPLESCAEGQLCTGGSFCSNGNCSCPVGRQIVNAQCVTPQTVDIGGNCLRVGIACGGGSICVAGHCVCPLGTTPNSNVCVQHRTALPGEACGNGEDCIGDSECDLTHRRCECVKETQMLIGNTCQERLRSHPGYPCSNNELCVGGSSCRNGRCSCAENEIEVYKKCVYRQLVAAGEVCGNGEECGGGSKCDLSQKKCTCQRGYQLLDGKCVYLTVVGPGDSCASNLVRCGGGSYCARGRCECSPSTVPVGGKCTKQKQVPPGNVCTSTDTCTGKAVCRNGVCQCLSGMILRSGSCEVRRKVMPSETCQPGDECLGGSKCNGFICECPPGQIGRDGVCRPRQTRRPGQVCHPEDICIGLAYCLDGLCQCKAGERIKDGKCIRGRFIIAGGSCTAYDECQGGSVCIGDICSCPQGKTLIGQQCKEVRRVPPGQPCNQTFVCDFGSACDEERKVCKCPDGAQNRSGRCLRVADRDRKVPIIVPVNHKRVNVPSPFLPLKTISSTVAPRSTTASNILSCLHNSDCGRGAICRGGACVCLSNMVMKNGRCILIQPVSKKRLGLLKEPCVTDEQCAVQNSFCLPIGICGCQPGFRVFGSTQCIRRMEPLSAKSFSLPTTTMPTVSSPRSLSQRTSSTTSFTSITSTTPSSTAPPISVTIFPGKRTTIENTVETPEFYGTKPSEMVQRYVLPGEECNRQLECIVGSVCIEGICRCPPAFLLVNNMCIRRKTHIVVPPSSSCALGETCGGNSNCQGGICICIDEFTLFRGECRTLPEIHSLIERESFIRLTTLPVRNKFHSLKTTKAPTFSTSSFATTTTTVEPQTTTPLSTTVTTTQTTTTEAATTATTTEKSSIPSSTVQSAITSAIKETEWTTKAPETTPPALPYIIDPFMPLPAVSSVLTPRPSYWFKIAKPGHSCDDMTFCTNCSVCIDNSCQCPEGLELQGGKCLSPIDARTCIASNHCPSGAECVSGVCRCQPGLALSRFGFCIPLTYVDPGMSCLEGEKCRGGSDCRDGICECPNGMNIRDSRCVPFSRDILSSMNRELNTPCPTTTKSSP